MIITTLRKALDGTVVDNTLKHGCGGINIDAIRIGNLVQDTSKNGRSPERHKSTVFQSGLKDNFEGKITTGRWPANFVLTHKEGCELKGTKKVKGHKGYPNGPGGIWSKDYQAKHQKDRNLTDVKTVKDNEAWMGHADKDGKETVEDWDCVEGCPVVGIDQQSGVSKSTGGRIGNAQGVYSNQGRTGWGTGHGKGDPGFGDEGGASRFFKQFKKEDNMSISNDMIEYFKTMITPPVEDACVVVSSPDDLDFSAFKKEVFEEGALIPTFEPMVHGIILLGEPTDEQAKEIMDILKPGGHVVLLPKDIGYKGVIALEDTGFEVRDAIFVSDDSDGFFYNAKASRSEREAGLKAEGEGRANIHPTVKPIEVMEWCARDIDANSKVVDPFLGSGTTGIAMSRLGHDFVGVELNPEYAKICEARIRHWMPIGTEIESEAQVGKAEPQKGEQISIFDIFGS